MDKSNSSVSPDAKLAACEVRSTTIDLPAPLSERLDQLVDLADEAGTSTNRQELLAALVLGAPAAASKLAGVVFRLRKAKAKDAATSADVASVLQLRRHRPGPRRKRGSLR